MPGGSQESGLVDKSRLTRGVNRPLAGSVTRIPAS